MVTTRSQTRAVAASPTSAAREQALAPLAVTFACFAMAATGVVTNLTISASPTDFAPEVTRYLGRFVFLTVQSNWILSAYFLVCVVAIVTRRPRVEWLCRGFPLVFALGAFLTVAYYALDHFNPAQVQARKALAGRYPYIEWSAHGEHALALPSVVLFALFVRVEHAKPSSADVLRAVGYYMAFYLVVTHANKTATGLWQYPILADLTAQGGAALRTVFFAVLIGINVAFGFLAKRILCAHEKRA